LINQFSTNTIISFDFYLAITIPLSNYQRIEIRKITRYRNLVCWAK